MYIPTALKKNKGWCEKFVERYAQVLDEYYEYSLELYDLMAAQIRPEMQRHVNRWGIMSYSEWESEVKRQREIIEARPKNIARQIQKEFNVSTERMEDLFPDFY